MYVKFLTGLSKQKEKQGPDEKLNDHVDRM